MVCFKLLTRAFVSVTLAFGLMACGGGGGGSAPTAETVTVSGTVTYTSFNLSASGIDYANPIEKPVRGSVIEFQNPPGTVVASANTSETGAYSFNAPSNTSVRVVVRAELGTPGSPNTKVVDNTNGGALYVAQKDITTGSDNVTQSFNIGSGHNGTDYVDTRAAAPFAMLDVIALAQKLVHSADSTVVFPLLTVNWSPKNKSVAGNTAVGEIETSHYNDGEKALYILGQKDVDTDEYDTHVMGHEWGHYFEANFSRSDSIGGPHSANGELLHPSVAFGEGYGYALAGMIMNDPLIIDTAGPGQKAGGVNNLETDSVDDSAVQPRDEDGNPATPNVVLRDGYASENSVQEVLYDLFDGGVGDDDALALGFAPIYKVLTNGQKNTQAFTSIFSFLHHLKLEVPASAEAINTLAAAENINAVAANEFDDPTDPVLPLIYTTVPPDGSVVTLDSDGEALIISQIFGEITAAYSGNKLLNQRFFKTTVATAGCYTVTATAIAPTAAADLVILRKSGGPVDNINGAGAEVFQKTYTDGEVVVFAVGAFTPNTKFTVSFSSSPSACTS